MTRCAWAIFSLLILAAPLHAQIMQGKWVDELNDKIDALRKTELRVIVLQADGKPAQDVAVHIEQLRHDFTLGFVVSPDGLPETFKDQPVLRNMNAVSLRRLTQWAQLQPTPLDDPDFSRIEAVIDQAQKLGLSTRWGGIVSADSGRNADWLAMMDNDTLAVMLEKHVQAVVETFGQRVDSFDLYTHSLDHHMLEERFGMAMVRKLYEVAHATEPQATFALSLENCLSELRLREAARHTRQLQQQFVPFTQLTLEQRLGGMLLQRQLAKSLENLGGLGAPVVVDAIEVGGTSDAAAANNLETLLRILFAEKTVEGIYFSGLKIADVADPTAALLDNAGSPTRPGAVVDGLFGEQWWTNITETTDELGNVQARVFIGKYRVTATLADGSKLQTKVYVDKDLPRNLPSHIVVLEPMAP